MSKPKVGNEGTIRNKSSTTWVDHKNSPLGPKKLKMIPKLNQNQESELKEL